jgi:flavodoxin
LRLWDDTRAYAGNVGRRRPTRVKQISYISVVFGVKVMGKTLVSYFSASGVTKKLAEDLSVAADADLFEIKPKTPYTRADLDWTDKTSRSSIEMNDPDSRPPITEKFGSMAEYDTVFVGFPIWWYVAPKIINTFLESYDFSGKTLIPFATSGGSGMGKTVDKLRPSCSDAATWRDGKLLKSGADKKMLTAWIESLNL